LKLGKIQATKYVDIFGAFDCRMLKTSTIVSALIAVALAGSAWGQSPQGSRGQLAFSAGGDGAGALFEQSEASAPPS
jgi:hypothetical protein